MIISLNLLYTDDYGNIEHLTKSTADAFLFILSLTMGKVFRDTSNKVTPKLESLMEYCGIMT